MKLPSSIPEGEFVHNATAFIPFSYGGSSSSFEMKEAVQCVRST